MTVFLGDPNQDIRDLVLKFLGSFTHVQTCIDELLARTYFEKRIPDAAAFVWKLAVSRIKDDERAKLVRAISQDVGSDAELENFNQAYMDMARLRNKLSHAATLQAAGDALTIFKSKIGRPDNAPVEFRVDRDDLSYAVTTCRWLEAQILYILDSSGLTEALSIGDRPIIVAKPAANREDYNGIVYLDKNDPGRCTM
ncbi:hypothetical protein [Mycobacterium sp. E2238]|uniref:hypothetical protein n=1 Tax=Mycobacterium sp. E2238 TaxID=1834131 RepID=UPI0007FF84D9|nr:hypothetical protein [Mycobacterium sp. E2238]OBI31102.1 hypothetical protein A5711_21645 [Mycobacterium sp. E2238]